MDFIIRELDSSMLQDLHRIDNEISIDSKLVLDFNEGRLGYTVIGVPGTTRRFSQDEYVYTDYPDDPEKTAFLAYIDGQPAGEIILRKNWNRFALVEWIGVDRNHRRLGIGRALMNRAVRWAQDKSLPGIMLETQDNNVGACRFYESCGFVLKGFDTGLYAAADSYRDDIALFWYHTFDNLT
jgi:streptothricin acetyltransferase